ncbi:S1C family serine protease [Haliangium sp.]|uniref:S1C family serine protease n=1 Tax=Haliangium sp. TaxID=2663208 RepID=UPI003D0D39AE
MNSQPGAPVAPSVRDQSTTVVWLAILLLLVAGALIWTLLRQSTVATGATAPVTEPPAEPPAEPAPRQITARGDLASDESATIELFRQASPAVVHITNLQARRDRISLNVTEIPQGTGSGFIWDDVGHVVTNYHVIQNADLVAVTLNDNTVWQGQIVGTAPDKDLAVVKISAPRDRLHPLSVGASGDLQVGQKVFAIGNPFGLDQTLTTGVISGLNREIKSTSGRPIYDVIQTDAAINPGNSGGPLLDSAGLLIGVNTAIYSPSGAYAGIGFAVPVDTVNRIVPQLVANGRVVKPGLGIQSVPDKIAARSGIKGVAIFQVVDGSAADKAGLRGLVRDRYGRPIVGDVIVGMDGIPIRVLDDLYRALDDKRVGDQVELSLQREPNGDPVTIELTLEDMDAAPPLTTPDR